MWTDKEILDYLKGVVADLVDATGSQIDLTTQVQYLQDCLFENDIQITDTHLLALLQQL